MAIAKKKLQDLFMIKKKNIILKKTQKLLTLKFIQILHGYYMILIKQKMIVN